MQEDDSLTLRSLLEEIIKSRNDLKSAIEASEARVLLKTESVNNKVNKLEKENRELRTRVEKLEKITRKNNIIIFGLNRTRNEVTPQYICNEIRKLLGVELVETDIDDVYVLGEEDNKPIKVQLLSHLKKNLIIKNCYKLKGKSVYISHDLTETQREEGRILRKYLKEAKEEKISNTYIKGNKLIINGNSYTAHDLKDIQITDIVVEKINNSAPATPSSTPRNLEPYEKATDSPVQEQIRETSQKSRKDSVANSPKTDATNNKLKKVDPAIKKVTTRSVATKLK